jgi:purine nucleosidase
VDDALALALALRNPDIDLRGVTTVSGDTAVRARIAARLIALAGGEGIEIAAGSNTSGMELNWSGREEEGIPPGPEAPMASRTGVDVLAGSEPGMTIATIGMQSNLAASVTRDPTMVERVRLVVMGGSFGPIVALDGLTLDASRDWNLFVDPQSAIESLSAGFRTLYVPVDVTMRVPLRQRHLDRLRTGDELCRTLAALVDVWRNEHLARPGSQFADVVALLHDPLTIACTVDRSFVTVESLPVRVELRDGVPRTLVDPERGREVEVVRSCDAAAFADWWLETVLAA